MQYVINALVKVKNAKATLHIPLFPVTTAEGRRLFALMPVSDSTNQPAASQHTLSAPSSDVEHSIDEEWGYQGHVTVDLLKCEHSPSASEAVDAAPSSDVEHSIDEEWGYQGHVAVDLLKCEHSPSASEAVDAAPSSDVEHSIDEEWGYQGHVAVDLLKCEHSPSASEAVDAAPSSDVEHSIDEEWGYQGHVAVDLLKCEKSSSSSEIADEGIPQLSHETVNLTNEAPQQTGPGSSSSSTEAVDSYKSKTASKVTMESHKSKSKTASKATKESIMSDKNVSWKDVNDGNSFWETSKSTTEASRQMERRSYSSFQQVASSSKSKTATKESLKSIVSDKNVSWKQKPTLSVHVNDSRPCSNNHSVPVPVLFQPQRVCQRTFSFSNDSSSCEPRCEEDGRRERASPGRKRSWKVDVDQFDSELPRSQILR